MVVVVAMVSALLIGLELSWRQAKAGPDWQTVPVAHAPNGPVVAR
jgi:uncharacterized membrane protein YhiD involved in acid resistance